jgi:hypothetical protein
MSVSCSIANHLTSIPDFLCELIAPGESPSVKAYDEYVKSAIVPLVQACDDLGGLQTMGKSLTEAWHSIRTIIILADRSKAPSEELVVAFAPQLAQTQAAVKHIKDLRLDRDWDRHHKAINEMLSCIWWILYRAPKQLPSTVVKDAIRVCFFTTACVAVRDEKQIARTAWQLRACGVRGDSTVGLTQPRISLAKPLFDDEVEEDTVIMKHETSYLPLATPFRGNLGSL